MIAAVAHGFHQLADHDARRCPIRIPHPEVHHIQLFRARLRLHFVNYGEHIGRKLLDPVKLLVLDLGLGFHVFILSGGFWEDGKLRPSPLLAIFLIVAVDVLGLTIMIPLLPFYAEKLGASPTQVGLLIGVYAACQLVSGPLLGRLCQILRGENRSCW